MIERLPSTCALSFMSPQDQFWLLQRIADALREEHQHILSGHYRPGPGHTRRSILAANRRRLARLHARADEFNVGIGQPEQHAA